MSSTLFVRNLPFDVTQEALEKAFGEIGPVKKVDVIKDKGKSKAEATTRGFAFVRFAMAADAQYALENLNQAEFGGRRMLVELAKEKGGQRKDAAAKPAAPKPTAVEPESVAADMDVEAEKKEKKKEKKEKKAKKEKKEAVAEEEEAQGDDDEDVTKKKKKEKKEKKAKKEKKEDVEEAQEAEEEEVAEVAEKKQKKEKTAKKEKKTKTPQEEAEEAEEEPLVEQKKKDKKKDKKPVNQDVVMEEEEPIVLKKPQPPTLTSANPTQSERNARRRMHREFLRQVELRKDATATSNEKSILIYGLGQEVTQKALFKKVKKIAAVTKVEMKEETKTSKKFAIVEFTKLTDVDVAVAKLDAHIFKGKTLKAVRMTQAAKDGDSALANEGARLIIRNLSFQATDADLTKLFGACGEVSEAKVVRLAVEKGDEAQEGKSRGFAFVQFRDVDEARAAITKLNGFKLKGREMIVDSALTKAKYLEQQKEKETGKEEEEGNKEEPASEDENDGENEDDDDGEDHGTAEMEEGDDDEEEDEEDDEEEDAEVEEDEEVEEENAPRSYKEDTDEQNQRTVFIRNLSFQTTEESMKEFFSTFGPVEYARVVMDKGSGLSKGVGFVRFKALDAAETVLSRGQAGTDQQQQDNKHSKYKKKNKKDTETNLFTLSALADGDALMLDGRMLIVSRTVAKDDATRLAEANSADRKKKDKRNMYLAYEGTINVNKVSDEDLELPKMDIEKRRRAIREKKEKLKNPLYFVSPTRLSVRNIGTFIDDKELKTLFKDAAVLGMKQSKVSLKELKVDFLPPANTPLDKLPVKVKMAKIVRDMDSAKEGKEPRSRGYGFVEFVEHAHALAALRVLNNNPLYSSSAAGAKTKKGNGKPLGENEKSRLIVEFALENHGKLKLREKKSADASKKRDEEKLLKEAQGDDEGSAKAKKASRGQRQREKKKNGGGEADAEEGAETKDAKTKTKTKPVVVAKTTMAKTPVTAKAADQKKRKRDASDHSAGAGGGDVDELGLRLPSGSARESGGAKPLSRKQRKTQKEREVESSFDALVRNYKKEIFGDKEENGGARKGDSSDSTFAMADGGKDRWFD